MTTRHRASLESRLTVAFFMTALLAFNDSPAMDIDVGACDWSKCSNAESRRSTRFHKIAATAVEGLAGPYTPTPPSRERGAILDALRNEVGGALGKDILFVVDYLKVEQGWAWVHTLPESYDGSNHYEDVAGLLQEDRNGWSVRALRPSCGECADDPECADDRRYFNRLRASFPSAPPDIFPDAIEVIARQRPADVSVSGGTPDHGETATVNSPGDGFLALRSAPSARRGHRLSKIPHGTRLTLQRCDVAAGEHHWCKTTYKDQSGWVLDRYLSREATGGHGEILSAVAGACPKDWCEASVERVLGGYASVLFRCRKTNCENAIGYLKRQSNGDWTLVDYGTGLTPNELVGYGFPVDVATPLTQ